jgi:hypothetical protein
MELKMSAKKSEPTDEPTTTMRVSRKTLRLIQIVAAWKNLSLSEYVDHLVRTQGARDIDEMKKEITNF